jgi:manganese/zinc/iron transport system substrate-binding protein
MNRWFLILGCAAALLLNASAADKKIRATATTGMVGDLVKTIGGERVTVETLMGPGVDPHLYKATASDVAKLQRADIIFYSGLMLEGKMQELFSQMSKAKKKVYAVTQDLPKDKLLSPAQFQGHHDPHVWFDVSLWTECTTTIARALSELDPAGKMQYEKNAEVVRKRNADLHQWAVKKAGELPKERRILVTSHDAYNYFGRAYEFQVVGLQGVSTVTEAGLADVAKLIDFIKEKKVKAIFVETSVPHATIERISRDAGVQVGGELFSDAMGTPGKMENGYDVGTYEGMIKHNLNTIVEALK